MYGKIIFVLLLSEKPI
uniref:Glycophorin A n=1 Tax=Homo sapiens TaxID=9606 RepID=K9JHF1_HUMAN|nr:glycophorin A [Homo sapiens]